MVYPVLNKDSYAIVNTTQANYKRVCFITFSDVRRMKFEASNKDIEETYGNNFDF